MEGPRYKLHQKTFIMMKNNVNIYFNDCNFLLFARFKTFMRNFVA